MNQRIKKLWIKALRSGKYKQGYRQLRRGRQSNVKHCCLGVLCEIAKEQGAIKAYAGIDGGLPKRVMAWAGLSYPLPAAGNSGLHSLNDAHRSFNYIADHIEKYL